MSLIAEASRTLDVSEAKPPEVSTGFAPDVGAHLPGGACGDDGSTGTAAARAHIDNVVRVGDQTEPSPVSPENLGKVDAVLLSHDEHDDHLDRSGRDFLAQVPVTLTTVSGARRLGGTARGLEFWEKTTLRAPDGTLVTVTGMPALHGPEGSEAVAGDVIGFLLTAPGHPSVYVSGDNASLALVEQIADRVGPIDIAVLFIGGVRHEPVLDGALVTMDNALAAQAAKLLGAHRVVPAHFEGWAHFREGREELIEAFTKAEIADRLTLM